MRQIAIFALAVACFSAPTAAEDGDGNCYDPLKLGAAIKPMLASVTTAEPRVHFRQSKDSNKACPSENAACKAKAYLIPKDEIIVGAEQGGYLCAAIISPKGRVTAGWLPKASVTTRPAPPVALEDWLGTWTAPEQKIVITRGKVAGTLAFDASATFGALDPERVKRGAINLGEFKAVWKPAGAEIAFTADDDKTLPFEKGDEFTCKVRMMRLGPHLITEDNRQCGGVNVSFSSVMRRGK